MMNVSAMSDELPSLVPVRFILLLYLSLPSAIVISQGVCWHEIHGFLWQRDSNGGRLLTKPISLGSHVRVKINLFSINSYCIHL